MTTGRINQVTLVKKNRNKREKERLRTLLSNVSILFFVTRTVMNFTSKLPGSGSVIRYDSVKSKEDSTHVCNNNTFVVRQSPSMSVICSKHPIAKSLIFFP